MNFIRAAILVLAPMILVGCGSLPAHTDVRVDEAAIIELRGRPGAEISVDGAVVGSIPENAKSVRVSIAPGTHAVIVRLGGRTVYERTVFLQRGTVKIIAASK
jgi:PEGA domain